MNREKVTALIAALRSGKYQQGKYMLRDTKDNYCCLGVACDLVIANEGKWFVRDDEKYTFQPADGDYPSANVLNPKIKKLYGFTGSDETTLMNMNDSFGKTFTEIAEWLEEQI